MDGVYFVVSSTDEPEAIYFTEEDAFAVGFTYVDVFDSDGVKISSYKINSEGGIVNATSEEDYTTNF